MSADIIIRNGYVIDTFAGVEGIKDIAIKGNRIIDSSADEAASAEVEIDAAGCIVSPGLIDHHLHMNYGGNDASVPSDVSLFPSGVTTGADAGSTGVSCFESFRRNIIGRSLLRIKAYINVCSAGMATRKYPENIDPQFYDFERIQEIAERYPDTFAGLKLRVSEELKREFSRDPVEETIRMAEKLNCRIVVHVTNPFLESEKLAELLRPGDVFCHCFHGKGNTIIAESGKIKKGIQSAAEKGLIFDACNGRYNFSFDVGKKAIDQGFFPQVISTDLNTMVLYRHPAFSLPFVMSKYINMGMDVPAVFKACTETPAELLGMSGQIGTLAAGSIADVAVFKLEDCAVKFYDDLDNSFEGNKVLAPQLTIKDGTIFYRDLRFSNELNR